MRKKGQIAMLVLGIGMLMLTGCGESQPEKMLYLNFDEGSGNEITDLAHTERKSEVQYRYTNAMFTENMDPQWRESGVRGGSLLFDGNSTYISYDSKELCLEGEQLSVDVWVAPRAFEWDDPNAKSMGTQEITAIVSQYNKKKEQGILLGYGRHGQLCLEIGALDE